MSRVNRQSDKTWCLDCFERREPWVIRWLIDHGVTFRHVVIEENGRCDSCSDALPLGTHVMSVRYPGTEFPGGESADDRRAATAATRPE